MNERDRYSLMPTPRPGRSIPLSCQRRWLQLPEERIAQGDIADRLYGQSCDLDTIVETSGRYEIPVICDSAEAMGTVYRGRKAGSGALMAAYSFNGNKIITTSGGGALTSADEKLIQRARSFNAGQRAGSPL
jgi:hypothetical protein